MFKERKLKSVSLRVKPNLFDRLHEASEAFKLGINELARISLRRWLKINDNFENVDTSLKLKVSTKKNVDKTENKKVSTKVMKFEIPEEIEINSKQFNAVLIWSLNKEDIPELIEPQVAKSDLDHVKNKELERAKIEKDYILGSY